MDCLLCETAIEEGEDYRSMPYVTKQSTTLRHVHADCGLRNVVGGIGHLTDHAYWCGKMGDPDMGLTYRESALAVRRWIDEHGVENLP